ncbi:hypothetical protein ACNKHP_14235 [Shigella boydii]
MLIGTGDEDMAQLVTPILRLSITVTNTILGPEEVVNRAAYRQNQSSISWR